MASTDIFNYDNIYKFKSCLKIKQTKMSLYLLYLFIICYGILVYFKYLTLSLKVFVNTDYYYT